MSKQPVVKPTLSRPRLSVSRLRDLPIWSKLGLIMIVPTIATVVVGTVGLVRNIDSANNADRTSALSVLAADAAALVHEVQNERAAAVLVLGGIGGESRTAFENQGKATDGFSATYLAQREKPISDMPESLQKRLESIDRELDGLPKMREQIMQGPALAMTIAVTRYTTLITDLLGIREEAAELAGVDSLARDMRAASALSTLKENSSVERQVILIVLSRNSLSSVMRSDYRLSIIKQDQSRQTFINTATAWQRDQYNQFVIGPDLREAYKLRGVIDALIESQTGDNDQLPADIFTAEQWDGPLAGKSDLLRNAEVEIDRRVITDTADARTSLWRQVLVETSVLLGMLLLAILFAWMVARSMARSLRELRHGALTLAQFGLPQAVARLRDPAVATQGSPHQVAERIADPLPVRSHDEFGQVAEAFNAVHLEAVRTAAEQAALRSSVATMFVNLARRSQILVDRLIGHLDRLERGEEDPDRLSELFQLDHLATRMRRNDENLLVLAGADSTRVQRDPATLLDVLRAAQSEVEHYTRIEFGSTDRDIEIASHSVNDLVHLVAELLDNATAFSPPDSPVIVEAKRVGDRAALLVEDRGIGIPPDQLAEHNERLSNPPVVDVAVSRMMGLVVVARLAARHGARVELRSGRERGIVAEVTLPANVLVPRALGGRGEGMPAGGQWPSVSPLALERGPMGPGGLGQRPDADPAAGRGPGSPSYFAAEPAAGPANGAFSTGSAFGHRTSTNGAQQPPPPPPPQPPVQPPVPPRRTSGLMGQPPGMPPASAPFSAPQQTPPAAAGPPAAPTSSRGLPAWSDLTGASPVSSPPPVGLGTPTDSVDRAEERWRDGDMDATAVIPRQRSGLPRRPPGSTEGPSSEFPAVPAAARPPAWPPAASPTTPQQPPAPAAGSIPEPPVPPGADMTAEMPAVRLDWEPASEENQGSAVSEQRFVDETMELPIYRELESAWFSTVPSTPAPMRTPAPTESHQASTTVAPSPDSAAQQRTAAAPAPVSTSLGSIRGDGAGGEASGGTEQIGAATQAAARRPAWQTAADEGWQAAAALAEERDFVRTETGLPKRVPMSQLVPGGVERSPTSSYRRTPEAVRGLLSAYHRGVQRGRTQHTGSAGDATKTPERSTAGPQTSQGGKEYEA
ncbi:MAG: HAMP domain-containing protein [Dactylosporangium sp.]|nr:nitrate- and nitrite sensing domain-containing protein [Dactylosporangium sp.]NNJ63110.1 HAMP domain-containing protein [Dactylosporangium sp.]